MILVLIRHGQSVWNQQNRFTGWEDVPLSEQGTDEAKSAADILKRQSYSFDIIYTSLLKRAIHTGRIIKDELGLSTEFIKNWRLNERHYGDLQGKNKEEIARIHGVDQVKIWRRSYDIPPPLLSADKGTVPEEGYPLVLGESLKETLERVLPYWRDHILPNLQKKKNILISAHGNSLRALMKELFSMGEKEIIELEIPTGKPILCEFKDNQIAGYRFLDQ